jgi:hypothetical protein
MKITFEEKGIGVTRTPMPYRSQVPEYYHRFLTDRICEHQLTPQHLLEAALEQKPVILDAKMWQLVFLEHG